MKVFLHLSTFNKHRYRVRKLCEIQIIFYQQVHRLESKKKRQNFYSSIVMHLCHRLFALAEIVF